MNGTGSSTPNAPANGTPESTTGASSSAADASAPPLQFTHTHALLKLRLAPLRQIETDLKLLIGAATEELPDISGLSGSSNTSALPEDPQLAAAPFEGRARRPGEYYVRANASWREAVRSAYHRLGGTDNGDGRAGAIPVERLEGATEIIASCAEDMQALWTDEVVRELLKRRKIKMELTPGL